MPKRKALGTTKAPKAYKHMDGKAVTAHTSPSAPCRPCKPRNRLMDTIDKPKTTGFAYRQQQMMERDRAAAKFGWWGADPPPAFRFPPFRRRRCRRHRAPPRTLPRNPATPRRRWHHVGAVRSDEDGEGRQPDARGHTAADGGAAREGEERDDCQRNAPLPRRDHVQERGGTRQGRRPASSTQNKRGLRTST